MCLVWLVELLLVEVNKTNNLKLIKLSYSFLFSNLQPTINFHGHTDGVVYCRFSPSGRLLASCGWDHRTCVWDMASKQLLQRLGGHTSPVVACSFAANEEYLVCVRLTLYACECSHWPHNLTIL
jgi:WD40 repeat protein